jgi:4-hydroxythreonine-4-phosphate dehydrogenase
MNHIYITLGDINGIGPEVTLKSLFKTFPQEGVVFSIVGDRDVFNYYSELLKIDLPINNNPGADEPSKINFIPVAENRKGFSVGTISRIAGEKSAAFIKEAVSLMKDKNNTALVTAPISKEALWRAGNLFPGQTEFISSLVGVKKSSMMLIAGNFRVAFTTTHHPLKDVPGLLNPDLIVEKCQVVREDLRRRFKIKKPKMAVAALNPHGGENGKLGTEEKNVIIPAIQHLQDKGFSVEGPFSSDTLFTKNRINDFDAFLALYHDQGMIPIKMHSFGGAVNYTAGLPIVRTSPDHGTAFDIAGKGIADASSMVEAINLALKLVK